MIWTTFESVIMKDSSGIFIYIHSPTLSSSILDATSFTAVLVRLGSKDKISYDFL